RHASAPAVDQRAHHTRQGAVRVGADPRPVAVAAQPQLLGLVVIESDRGRAAGPRDRQPPAPGLLRPPPASQRPELLVHAVGHRRRVAVPAVIESEQRRPHVEVVGRPRPPLGPAPLPELVIDRGRQFCKSHLALLTLGSATSRKIYGTSPYIS